jgi:hypothetical protein
MIKEMKDTKETVIERIVAKYPYSDSKELFRAELEYLCAIAEKEELEKQLTK